MLGAPPGDADIEPAQPLREVGRQRLEGLYSYGPCSYGLCSYGPLREVGRGASKAWTSKPCATVPRLNACKRVDMCMDTCMDVRMDLCVDMYT